MNTFLDIHFKKIKIPKSPMILVFIFQMFTLALFLFGPQVWYNLNKWIVGIYVIVCNLGVLLGYFLFKDNSKSKYPILMTKRSVKIPSIISSIVIIAFFVLLIDLINTMKLQALSFNAFWEAIEVGFLNPAEAYYKPDGIVLGGKAFIFIKVLLSPIVWGSIPISLVFFKKLRRSAKVLAIVNIALEALKWICSGTNKGIFDLVFICIALVFIQIVNNDRIRIKKLKKVFILLLILLIVAGTYFVSAIGDRVNSSLVLTHEFGYINTNHLMWQLCPDVLKRPFLYILDYLTQGYYGLYLTLSQPPVIMFGVGHSAFLLENFSEFFNINLTEYTLQFRAFLDTGWHHTVKWHSIYSWIANDVTFIFVPIVMFFNGLMFAALIKDIKVCKSPLAIILFCLLFINFMYFSANNQIGNYPTTAFPFYVLTPIWLVRRRKYVCTN